MHIGNATVTLAAPAQSQYVNRTTVGSSSFNLTGGTAVTANLTVTGLNSEWFTVTATMQVSAETPTTLTLTGTPPSATLTMPAGSDVTVTVNITPIDTMGITISTTHLDYGAHNISINNQNIPLGSGPTQPADVVFEVFNGTGAAGWTLQVSSGIPTGGNDELARRMFLEGGVNTIMGAPATVFSYSANTLINNFNWASASFTGVEVRTVSGDAPPTTTLQAALTWTVVVAP